MKTWYSQKELNKIIFKSFKKPFYILIIWAYITSIMKN